MKVDKPAVCVILSEAMNQEHLFYMKLDSSLRYAPFGMTDFSSGFFVPMMILP
ncbi:MAG: hypothetical protein JW764_00440 [Chlorobiaceae bacterium]|nr:hypothetical protein [Chlorobiaceae bacterium]